MFEPLISICIPAYRKPEFVARCLDSVGKQDYKKVEVIISDDSPDEDIKELLPRYKGKLSIRYYHNQPPLRSPRNWNAALDKGEGDLLLLMHQDDWFHSEKALSRYVSAFRESGADMVFCRNTAVDETGKETVLQGIPSLVHQLYEKPNHLVRAQVIGPPSNAMLRRSVDVRYDERFIWLVDVDYYVRILKKGYKYTYLDEHLVSIGLHEDQTTVFCRTHTDIIFRENVWFAGKLEPEAFRDLFIYDYFWRLLRNYGIRKESDLEANGIRFEELPPVLKQQYEDQKKLPLKLLKFGPFSKTFMLRSYLSWKNKRPGT